MLILNPILSYLISTPGRRRYFLISEDTIDILTKVRNAFQEIIQELDLETNQYIPPDLSLPYILAIKLYFALLKCDALLYHVQTAMTSNEEVRSQLIYLTYLLRSAIISTFRDTAENPDEDSDDFAFAVGILAAPPPVSPPVAPPAPSPVSSSPGGLARYQIMMTKETF